MHPPEQLEEQRLDLIICVVCCDNPASAQLLPEGQCRVPTPGPGLCLEAAAVEVMVVKQVKREIEGCGLCCDKRRLVVSFRTKVMVKMEDVKGPAPEALELVQGVQQRDGIRAAADAEEKGLVPELRTGTQQVRVELLEKGEQSAT